MLEQTSDAALYGNEPQKAGAFVVTRSTRWRFLSPGAAMLSGRLAPAQLLHVGIGDVPTGSRPTGRGASLLVGSGASS
jgi:hypothetical protein